MYSIYKSKYYDLFMINHTVILVIKSLFYFKDYYIKKSDTVKKNIRWLIVTLDCASLKTIPPPSMLEEKY